MVDKGATDRKERCVNILFADDIILYLNDLQDSATNLQI